MSWWHTIEHWLGWNFGQVVSALDERGTVWIGYKCLRCGRVTGIHATHPPHPTRFQGDG